MKSLAIAVALATMPGVALAESDWDAQMRALNLAMSAQELDAPAGVANSCGAAPLPLTPVGPVVNASWRFGADAPVSVKAWRYPCSASDSMIVLTLTPTDAANPTFICGPSLLLLQAGGLQTDALFFRTDPATSSSFCADVVSPVTVAIIPRSSTPAAFDFDQATTIDFDGASAGHQTVAVAAFNPGAYNLTPPPGPDSASVFVRGTGSSFQNCTVTTAPAGAGTRYTATCAAQAPLQANGFDTYP